MTKAIKGKIELRRLNLMGYTPETQMWIVQNAGHKSGVVKGSINTFHFLNNLMKRNLFDRLSDGNGLRADRLPAFILYCDKNGFEVEKVW